MARAPIREQVATRAVFLIAKINERSNILLGEVPSLAPREAMLLSNASTHIRRIHQQWVVAINGLCLDAEECEQESQLAEMRGNLIRCSEMLRTPCRMERRLIHLIEQRFPDDVKAIFHSRYRRLGWEQVLRGV